MDIARLLADLARLIRRSLPDNITLTSPVSSTAASDLFALADPALLESALLNFALNARDAMPGGGCLTVSAEAVELPADAPETAEFDVPPGHYVSIAVADDGCGMDAQTLAHAWASMRPTAPNSPPEMPVISLPLAMIGAAVAE